MRTLKTPEESGVVPLVTLAVMNKAFQNLGGTGLTPVGQDTLRSPRHRGFYYPPDKTISGLGLNLTQTLGDKVVL